MTEFGDPAHRAARRPGPTPEEAAKIYDRSFRGIFQRWRNLGRI